jgi:prepilin-type N-terminal cleavage/methylation domain-containing protein
MRLNLDNPAAAKRVPENGERTRPRVLFAAPRREAKTQERWRTPRISLWSSSCGRRGRRPLHARARALPGLNLNPRTRSKRTRSGFTLAEVLAALLLLAIVIPVALQGLRVASTAGEVGQRKMVAARIGNKVLNELKVMGQLQNTGQTGVVQDHGISYRWTVKNQSWSEDALSQMILATLTVSYSASGKNYNVQLSTLVAPPPQMSSSTMNTGIY